MYYLCIERGVARFANMKSCSKVIALFIVLAVFITIGLIFRRVDVHLTKCECDSCKNQVEKAELLSVPISAGSSYTHFGQTIPNNHLSNSQESESKPQHSTRRWLSYQPPGNGWNNQRIVLENALVLAKLLNRTLLVHPLSPHELGNKLKQVHHLRHGYISYNMMEQSDLLPISNFMDLELMSKVTPVEEVKTTHPQFFTDYSHLTWRNVCHSGGYGYWMDQVPEHSADVALFAKQKFSSLGKAWKDKCPEEMSRVEKTGSSSPLVRFVTDLQQDSSEMLYFEAGTLFGIHIRFSTYERALEAQNWIVNYVRYNSEVWARVEQVANNLGGFFNYNAIQVRRGDHMDRKLPPSFWIERMIERNFSTLAPVYVATNDVNMEWFQAFFDAGFQLYFSTNFTVLDFRETRDILRLDFLGIHEQCICEKAKMFIPSPASTFDAFILRHRGEVKTQDELMMDTLHTYWIGHQLLEKAKL